MAQGMWFETTREFWICFEKAYLRFLGVAEANLDEAVEVMFSEVFGKEPKPIWRHLLQDNIDALHSVAATGMPLAIVSNNDGSAEQQMMDFGVCQVGAGTTTWRLRNRPDSGSRDGSKFSKNEDPSES